MHLEDNEYVHEVKTELERRDMFYASIRDFPPGERLSDSLSEEKKRQIRWAQEMILANPALCAELYVARSGNHKDS